jgi:hypothetical protein
MRLTKENKVIIASGYSVFIGVCIIALWAFFFAFRFVPEIKITIYILLNSILLIWGGILLALEIKFGKSIWYLSSIILIYSYLRCIFYAINEKIFALAIVIALLLLILIWNIYQVTKIALNNRMKI